MISFPNAKINIGLNVVSKRNDGYHNLETIFYPVKLADALEIVEAGRFQLTISGLSNHGSEENNLVFKAYKLLKEEYNLPPVKIHLHKMIPIGAGLGGGSSDAAFALKMLNTLFNIGISKKQLENYASKIGADCPFFIENKPTFASGIGNQFEKVDLDISEFQIIIVKPPIEISTPEAFKNIVPAKPGFNLKNSIETPVEEWREHVLNDFEASVFPEYPIIEQIKEQLYQMGALFSSMSGSGSSVYGIFRHLPMNPDKYLPKGIYIYR